MELLDYINSHMLTWEQDLAAEPYYLKITHDGPYVMLKYQQFISDMSNLLCQQARGAIFRLNENKTAYIPVSVAMCKFFNVEESNAAEIDWSTAEVQEKVDGSLIKLGYDWVDKHWLLSTNGTIYAANASLNKYENYGQLFMKVLSGHDDLKTCINYVNCFLSECLDKDYCYYFEMVSPESRIVCKYGRALYYIGRRNMKTFEEDFERQTFYAIFNIKYPAIYPLSSRKDCIAAAYALGENKEGFVVRDAKGNRVKIKTPWYVAMHHIRGNGVLTVRRAIELWTTDLLDDFTGNFPEYQDFVQKIMNKITVMIKSYDNAYKVAEEKCANMSRKDAANFIQSSFSPGEAAYIFARKAGKVQNGAEYVFNNAKRSYRKFGDYIAAQLDTTEYGVEEDV